MLSIQCSDKVPEFAMNYFMGKLEKINSCPNNSERFFKGNESSIVYINITWWCWMCVGWLRVERTLQILVPRRVLCMPTTLTRLKELPSRYFFKVKFSVTVHRWSNFVCFNSDQSMYWIIIAFVSQIWHMIEMKYLST